MRGHNMVRVAVAIVAVVAACGGDGDSVTTKPGGSASATTATTTTDTTVEPVGWCDELSALRASGDLTPDAIAGAPDEIEAPLEVLAGAADIDPQAGSLAPLLRAQAAVESWGYEHCGSDHPFCYLWITFAGAIAASAFADADQEDVDAELRSFLDEMDDVLIEYAPPEMLDHVRAVLESVGSTSALSDADERAAEAADDALDQWTWTQGCEAASQPQADD